MGYIGDEEDIHVLGRSKNILLGSDGEKQYKDGLASDNRKASGNY